MAIIPTLRCRRMQNSITFYTTILGFECLGSDPPGGDPSFSVLAREGDRIFVSSHAGDGAFGQAIVIPVDDVDALFHQLRSRGLDPTGRPESPVYTGPTDQTWGTREFYVDDPDGNTVRFVQGLR